MLLTGSRIIPLSAMILDVYGVAENGSLLFRTSSRRIYAARRGSRKTDRPLVVMCRQNESDWHDLIRDPVPYPAFPAPTYGCSGTQKLSSNSADAVRVS